MIAQYKKWAVNTGFTGALALVTGLVYSPALQSIGVFLLFLHLFLNWPSKEGFKKNGFSLILIALVGISLFSGIYSQNHAEFWRKITVKLPFLLLPIAFLSKDIFTKRQFHWVLFTFIISVFITACITLGDYIVHYKAINEQLMHSKPIFILFNKINHIYYSILLAFSIWASMLLYYEGFLSGAKNKWFIALAAILLILMHIISARTGVIGFYASGGVVLLWIIIKQKKIVLGIVAAVLLAIIFISAYKFLPAWQNREANTQEDLSRLKEGKDINHYSISMRMAAIKTAWEIYEEQPILGVGEGDLQDEMNKKYDADHSSLIPENRKLPHNQFLQELATTGIPGFIILLLVFILPFTSGFAQKNLFFLCFIVLCLTAFQVESVLERQVGITFFAFFYLAIPKIYRENSTKKDT